MNSLIPVAATRMTENLGMPEDVFKKLKPESVSPAVLFMASEDAPTGIMLSAGAGVFAKSKFLKLLVLDLLVMISIQIALLRIGPKFQICLMLKHCLMVVNTQPICSQR